MNIPVLRLVQRYVAVPGHTAWVMPGEIAIVMGFGPNTAHRELAALAQEGYLTIVGPNRYGLTEAGIAALAEDEAQRDARL